MTARLNDHYRTKVKADLRESRGYRNVMQIPRLSRIVVNIGVGADVDRDALKAATDDLARLTGQRPVVTRARKSISNFKLREGMPIGAKVTLRGDRMYEFFDRLVNVALPRIRDFRGVPVRSFDGSGNYTLGVKEQSIFPEINPDQVKRVQGMDITMVTTAATDEEARELLRLLGMPFAK
jgi:large subunit ribosomal protein L5